MDIRNYIQLRDRINSSVTYEQLDLVAAEVKKIKDTTDRKDLQTVIETRRTMLAQLSGGGRKPLISSVAGGRRPI